MENKSDKSKEENPQEIGKKLDNLIDKELEELQREIESDKQAFEYQKKYLIEEVLNNGNSLADEIEARKEVSFETSQKSFDELLRLEEEALTKKKSFWSKFLDFIFK